jgi:hypothetical protein
MSQGDGPDDGPDHGLARPDDEQLPVDLDFDALDQAKPSTTGGRPRRARLISALVVLALVVVAAGGLVWSRSRGSTDAGPAEVTIRGTIILTNAATLQANCIGQGGYSDLRAGAPVVLSNRSGDTLSRTQLQRGQPDYDDGICSYPFAFTAVPTDQAQYVVEVAHRGKILKSRAEMTQSGWTYFLALT